MTHPNTDQGVTAEDIVTRLRKQADRIGLLLTDPPQETVDGALMREAADEIVSLKQRLESAEEALRPFADFIATFDAQPNKTQDDEIYAFHNRHGRAALTLTDCRLARAFLQEQEKQNG